MYSNLDLNIMKEKKANIDKFTFAYGNCKFDRTFVRLALFFFSFALAQKNQQTHKFQPLLVAQSAPCRATCSRLPRIVFLYFFLNSHADTSFVNTVHFYPRNRHCSDYLALTSNAFKGLRDNTFQSSNGQ